MTDRPAPASAEPPIDIGVIGHYHAHVYYDPASSSDRAARLRERVAAAFPQATLQGASGPRDPIGTTRRPRHDLCTKLR